MNYKEVIDYMYGMLPMYQRIGSDAFKKDLTNTLALCEAIGNPQESFKSIHIAGTNGKGSSSHMIAAILQEGGYKTGLYTSPHLKNFNERIKINGEPIGEDQVIAFIEMYQSLIEEIRPSFFELTVAMSFYYFAVNKVDIAVIEVGLGGRLDSTNVITPVISLITNISYDHQDMLGRTLPEIAFEKAGIIKPNVPVVISESQNKTNEVFSFQAKKLKSRLFFAEEDFQIISNSNVHQELKFTVKGNSKEFNELNFKLTNPGQYQIKNLPGVLKVMELINTRCLPIKQEWIESGLSKFESITKFKGRWQTLSVQPNVIADIGHNYAGLKENIKQLEQIKNGRLYIILGFVNDKPLEKILTLFPKDAFYFFCEPKVPRALKAHDLHQEAKKTGLNGEVVPDVNKAYKNVLERAGDKDLIYIGGSTFVVSEIENL